MALPLIVIGPLQGFRMMGLGGSAFTSGEGAANHHTASRAASSVQSRAEVVGVPFGGGALSRRILAREGVRWQRSGGVRVRVKMMKFEGPVRQHAARSPRMVRESFTPPRAVMLTLNRQPDQR